MDPGKSACFECAPPLAVGDDGVDERDILRAGVCAASLPTTNGLISALLAQNALKYLLGFGQVSKCIGYNALSDHFTSDGLRASPDCESELCRALQEEFAAAVVDETSSDVDVEECDAVEHESNEWNIQVAQAGQGDAPPECDVENTVVVEKDSDLLSLAAKLKAMRS
eukprot:TRINITY_DN10023_c0_g1_i1.p1 TRINITY_DN10023_c0_g1~~TRINITY_DN10023_c0_g1_i1.p1  ORF type:complete len:168 (+),score=20.39 TRINITY_DN10023_c0_g1_i1:407-910(+)